MSIVADGPSSPAQLGLDVPRLPRTSPSSEASSLVSGGATSSGQVRGENEDQFLVATLGRWLQPQKTSLRVSEREPWLQHVQGTLLAVADGMGAPGDGRVASRMAVSAIAEYVTHMMPWLLQLGAADRDRAATSEELERAFRRVNQRIVAAGKAHRDVAAKMGTTLTMAYVACGRAFIVHVGDSRLYLHREGAMHRITRDQNLAQKLVEKELMSREDAAVSAFSHVLESCLGGGNDDVAIALHELDLRRGDTLLLCSDGLTRYVADTELSSVLEVAPNPQSASDTLVNLANQRGGADNITVVVSLVGKPGMP